MEPSALTGSPFSLETMPMFMPRSSTSSALTTSDRPCQRRSRSTRTGGPAITRKVSCNSSPSSRLPCQGMHRDRTALFGLARTSLPANSPSASSGSTMRGSTSAKSGPSPWLKAIEAWKRLALVDIEQHLYDDARRKLELALQVDNAEGDDHHAADCLDGLGIVACEAGTYERAASKFAEAIDRYPLSAGLQPRAWVRMDLAQATLLLGRRTEARQHARYAHDVGTSHGDLGLMMWAEHSLALLDVLDGDFDQARANLTQSLTRAMLLGNLRPRLRALEGFAILAAAAGQPESALTLIAALDSIRHQIGLRRAETEYAMISPALESSRAVLSGAAQIRATDSGAQKTLEQATEFAREI